MQTHPILVSIIVAHYSKIIGTSNDIHKMNKLYKWLQVRQTTSNSAEESSIAAKADPPNICSFSPDGFSFGVSVQMTFCRENFLVVRFCIQCQMVKHPSVISVGMKFSFKGIPVYRPQLPYCWFQSM